MYQLIPTTKLLPYIDSLNPFILREALLPHKFSRNPRLDHSGEMSKLESSFNFFC